MPCREKAASSDMSRLYYRGRREDREAKNAVFVSFPPPPAACAPSRVATVSLDATLARRDKNNEKSASVKNFISFI